MLRCESRNSFVCEFLRRIGESVSDGEDSRIKHTDDVSSVCLVDHLSLARHELLRLGETDLFAALNVIHIHSRIKFTGTDPHKRDPVPVRFVHIGLYFKDKG